MRMLFYIICKELRKIRFSINTIDLSLRWRTLTTGSFWSLPKIRRTTGVLSLPAMITMTMPAAVSGAIPRVIR